MLSEQRLRELEADPLSTRAELSHVTEAELRQLIAAARVANALERWQRTDTLPAWRALEAAHRLYTHPEEVAK